jgi:hypothetical protein
MKIMVALLLPLVCSVAVAQEELSLFDGSGRAVAYVVADDDLTIHLWSGEPVAYLARSGTNDFNVYGFNGKHLGWFVDGVVRDHDGDVTCALRDAIANAQLEPFEEPEITQAATELERIGTTAPAVRRRFAL